MAGSWAAAVTEGNHGQLVRQSQCEALTQIKDATAISGEGAHARRSAKDRIECGGLLPRGGKIVPTRKADSAAWLASSNLGSHALIFDDDEVVRLLRAAVEREGSQVGFARRHDLDRVYLNMVLNRKRPVGEKVAKALGLRKVYTSAE